MKEISRQEYSRIQNEIHDKAENECCPGCSVSILRYKIDGEVVLQSEYIIKPNGNIEKRYFAKR